MGVLNVLCLRFKAADLPIGSWLPVARLVGVLILAQLVEAAPVRVLVYSQAGVQPVSRYLFGKFTEHLGRNVYLGAWAQLVENPEFAPATVWPDQQALTRRLQEASERFRLTELVEDARHHVPAFWQASDGLRVRWLEASRRYVAEVTAIEEGALLTGIYPPLHRTRRLELTVRARAATPTRLTAQLASLEGTVLGALQVPVSSRWTNWTGVLEVHEPSAVRGRPYWFKLSFPSGSQVELDSVRLFPADHVDGWESEVVDYLRRARLPMLRFPGGNFASGYHWADGVGPWYERPVLPNPAWPEVEWNHVGTGEWLRLCELIGAQPLICVNAGNGTAEEAGRWVSYCNSPATVGEGRVRASHGHPEPYRVRYWEVGNELWGDWQIGHTDGLGYAHRYRQFADAMLRVDPELLLIANGQARELRGPKIIDLTPGWNEILVRQNGRRVRSLSVHTLEGGGARQATDPVEVWKELVAFADAYLEYLDSLVVRPMQSAGLIPKVAVTEMQIFTNRPELPNNKTIAEALWLASLIHQAIRGGGLVELITHSALMNHGGGLAKDRGVVYAEPVWWTTHLYASQEGLYPQPVRVEGSPVFSTKGTYLVQRDTVPWVDAAALASAHGRTLTVFILNRHPMEPMQCELIMNGFSATQASATTLAASSLLERNRWDDPERIRPMPTTWRLVSPDRLQNVLPPLSLTRVVCQLTQPR